MDNASGNLPNGENSARPTGLGEMIEQSAKASQAKIPAPPEMEPEPKPAHNPIQLGEDDASIQHDLTVALKPRQMPIIDVDALPLISGIGSDDASPSNDALLLDAEQSADIGDEGLPTLLLNPEAVETPIEIPAEPSETLDLLMADEPSESIELTLDSPSETGSDDYVKNEFFVSEGADDPWILPAAAAAATTPNQRRKSTGPGKPPKSSVSKTTASRTKASKTKPAKGFRPIRTFAYILSGLAFFLVLALVIAWLFRGVIFKGIENNIVKKAAESGVFLEYDKWNWEPGRGIVLKDITVYEDAEKTVPYAKTENIGFNTDMMKLWKTRDVSLSKSTISLKKSNVQLFDSGELIADIREFDGEADIEMGDRLITVEQLTGQLEDVRFDVAAEVIYPEPQEKIAIWQSAPEYSSISTSARHEVRNYTKQRQGLFADRTRAQAQQNPSSGISFAPRNDLQDKVEQTIRARPVNPPVESAPVVDRASDAIRELSNSSRAQIPEQIDVSKGIDTNIVTSEPATPLGSTRRKSVGSSAQGDPIELPSLAFLRSIIPFTKIDSGDKSSPLLTSKIDADLSDANAPQLIATGQLSGELITMKESMLQGMSFHSVKAPYRYDQAGDKFSLNNFTVGYGDGALAGGADYGITNKWVNVYDVHSTIDIVKLLGDFDPQLKSSMKSVSFLDAPEIKIASGSLPIEKPLDGVANFSYKQAGGLLIDAAGKELPIRDISGDFKFEKGVLSVPNLIAKVLDGATNVTGGLNLSNPMMPFDGSMKVRGLPMESIAKFAGIESSLLKGNLDLDYEGRAAKELTGFNGKGSVNLENGQLYKVPVIGPLQRLLGTIVPAFKGEESTSAVKGNYLFEKGVLTTSDLMVNGDGTQVGVKGLVDLNHQLTAFSAKASLEGPLGNATGLSGEYLEVEGRGSLSKPKISLKGGSLPQKLLSGKVRSMLGISESNADAITSIVQGLSGSGGKPVQGIINNAANNGVVKEAAGSAIRKAIGGDPSQSLPVGESATQVLKGFQGLLKKRR